MIQSLEEALLNNNLATIILAAGKGTRMNTGLPKVLHILKGKTLIEHVLFSAKSIEPEKIVLVIGYKYKEVMDYLNDFELDFVIQENQLGTGHAIMKCRKIMSEFKGHTLILSGDVPLLTAKTLSKLYKFHLKNKADATVLTALAKNPKGYGRIIREKEYFKSIVEEKDANIEQKKINEINSGVYIFNNEILFENINEIDNKNNQNEYYLPDVLQIICNKKFKVLVYQTENINEIKGINNQEQLNELEKKI